MKFRIFLVLALIFVSGCCRETTEESVIWVYFSRATGESWDPINKQTSGISIKIDLGKGEADYSGLNGELLRKINYAKIEKGYNWDDNTPIDIEVSKKLSSEDKDKINRIYSSLLNYELPENVMGTYEPPAWNVKIILPNKKSFTFTLWLFVESTDWSEPPYHPINNPNVYGEFIPYEGPPYSDFGDSPITEFLILLKQIFPKELNIH